MKRKDWINCIVVVCRPWPLLDALVKQLCVMLNFFKILLKKLYLLICILDE